MEITEAIMNRHSVRRYMNIAIKDRIADEIRAKIDDINSETGLGIQLVQNDPEGFKGILAHYGSFSGVNNYIVMAGPEGMDKEIGYYGEELVILAQQLGLNTCWVALTFNKKKVKTLVKEGDKLYLVISVGVGSTQGVGHKSKPLNELSNLTDSSPEWFRQGVYCASLAPTAINQQKFYFEYKDNGVVSSAGKGPLTELDLGIAEYHFDVGSGMNTFRERLKTSGR